MTLTITEEQGSDLKSLLSEMYKLYISDEPFSSIDARQIAMDVAIWLAFEVLGMTSEELEGGKKCTA